MGHTAAAVIALVMVLLVLVGYPVASETLWNGRTLGKAALGLRVVTVEGGPVRFRHSAIRGIVGAVRDLRRAGIGGAVHHHLQPA